jgi:glycosyltransferase involved in cell wall biosynthesis
LKLELGFRAGNINLLRQLIKEIKPDVIHCHQNLVNYIFPLTIIFPTIKFFHTIHNDAPKEVSNALEYYFRRFFYSLGIVKAITISNETSQSFIKYYKTKNYHEIYNGRKQPLPSSEFKKVKDYIDGIRIKSDLVFLHIARCAPQKNQKMLIEVFNRLIDEGKSVALIILGNGFDSPVGDELKLMASEMIYFLGIKPNVADYYLNSDAFCLSSIHEGMPITLIEAFACGCVPICTPVGGISDSIENGITGFLSKSISADEYYKAILAYIEQKVKINKEYLIEHYNLRFSIRGCAHQHIKLFEK